MSARIREFAEQCVGDRPYKKSFDPEKFAELILFECIKIAVFRGDLATAKAIKQHFGVEE